MVKVWLSGPKWEPFKIFKYGHKPTSTAFLDILLPAFNLKVVIESKSCTMEQSNIKAIV